jgi:hypothetical protein
MMMLGFSRGAEQQTANDWPSVNDESWMMRHEWVPDAWIPLDPFGSWCDALLSLMQTLSLVQPKVRQMVEG